MGYMTLLFVIGRMNGIAGGAERSTTELINQLASKGHEILLAALYEKIDKSRLVYKLDDRIRLLGVEEKSRPLFGSVKCARFAYAMRQLPAIRELAADRVVSIISIMCSAIIPLGFTIRGARHYGVEHICIDYYKKRKFLLFLFSIAALRLRNIVFVADGIHDIYPKSIRDKALVIPNIIPYELLDIANNKPYFTRSTKRKFKFVSVGRFEEQKDPFTLIRSIKMLRGISQVEFSLDLYGEGFLLDDAKRLTLDLGLSDVINFRGLTSNINELYASYSAFVSASRYESFGYVFVEAMCFKLPIIVCGDISGLTSAVTSGNSCMIEWYGGRKGERSRDLALKLKHFMESPSTRLKMVDRLSVNSLEDYQASSVAERWEKLLNDQGIPR